MRHFFSSSGNTWSSRGGTAPAAATPARRSLAVLSAAAMAAAGAVLAAPLSADAVVFQGGGRNDDGTPAYIRDSNGLAVQMCTDTLWCEPGEAPDIGTYFSAEAAAGPVTAIWGIDAAFLENAADQVTTVAGVSNSALFRGRGLRANRTYTLKGPWGTHRCTTDGTGRLDNKNCLFERGGEAGGPIRRGPVKSLLLGAFRPAGGFLGNGEAAQRVTGSTTGFNRFQVRGPGVNATTRFFAIGGQMVDNMPMSQVNRTWLRMGNRKNFRRVTRTIRFRSVGTAASRVLSVRKDGRNPGAFRLRNQCRGQIAPGRRCSIEVIYRPRRLDSRAVLIIDDNTMAKPRRVQLRGVAPRR